MEIGTTDKIAVFAGNALGVGAPAMLDSFVDTTLAAQAVASGKIKYAEAYAMWARTSVMVPLLTGIPAFLIGAFGDKWLAGHKSLQLGLLVYGSAATISGLVNWLRGLQARSAAGVPLFFPTGQETPANTQLNRAPTYILPPGLPAGQPQAGFGYFFGPGGAGQYGYPPEWYGVF